ncbi:MAG TPA: Ig-like domain-containing protein, partial [Gemmatimonadaceae bacterium]
MRGSVVSAVAALAAVLVGCGGGTTSPPPVPVFTTLQVTPDTATLIGAPGTTTQLTATPLDQNGSAMSGLGAATWSSDDAAHATVNSSGLVTSVAVGGPVTITGSL